MDRLDTFVSRLSTRNNFWHRVCSLIWLPYAFKSGIRMKRIDPKTFAAVLPFRRFNRNWYNAMAGAALLANSEVAGGMYVFGTCGGDFTVVCKNLEYRFLRPCFGPAIYRITPRENLEELAAANEEFNVTLDLDIVQQIGGRSAAGKERRVGRCTATFHVTPKVHQKKKGRAIRG
jgi:acyl-coenzyme A thioesterase PaaI-like protein